MALVDRLVGFVSPAAALRRAIALIESGQSAEAIPLLGMAAHARIPEAEYRMALCYFAGSGVPPTRGEGGRWLQRAAEDGEIEAQALLGALSVHGLAGSLGGERGERRAAI